MWHDTLNGCTRHFVALIYTPMAEQETRSSAWHAMSSLKERPEVVATAGAD